MEFCIDKKDLERLAKAASRGTSQSSPLPVLSHILIQATSDRITLTGTSLDLEIRISYPVLVLSPGAVLVHAKTFLDIVSKLPSTAVSLRSLENSVERALMIECGRTKAKINTLPEEEFPVSKTGDYSPPIFLAQNTFRRVCDRVCFSTADSKDSRAVMTGVKVQCENNTLSFISTDGRRLSWQEVSVSGAQHDDFERIIPGKAMEEAARLCTYSSDENLLVFIGSNRVAFQVDSVFISSAILEGTFPDHNGVIPGSCRAIGTVDRESLSKSIKRVLVASTDKQCPNLLMFKFSENEIRISSNSANGASISDSTAANFDLPQDTPHGYNGKYFAEALDGLDCEKVEIRLQDEVKSTVILAEGQEDFKHVLMPVRLREVVVEAEC